MKKGTRPLVVGNWKMNPQSASSAAKLAKELKAQLAKVKDADAVIAPPAVFLECVSKIRNGSRVYGIAVQNVHHEKLGAHTGEISIPMVSEYGASYVIIGHSERRAAGETDEQVHTKLISILKSGLTPVVCVGERNRDEGAHYLSYIESQVRSALAQVPKAKLGNVVIAYEPIWAIGTGNTATSGDVHEMALFIEKVLSDIYGRNYAQKVRLLYGGSVNEKNAQELFANGGVDGFLVGGASLHADEFVNIVKQTIM
jgi:triosephosphate isomerase (TIM)